MALAKKEAQESCTRLMAFATNPAQWNWTALSTYLLKELRVNWAHQVGTGNDTIYVELYKGAALITSTTIASNSLPGDAWSCVVVHACATLAITTIPVGPVVITLGQAYTWKCYISLPGNGVNCYGRCGAICGGGWPAFCPTFRNYGDVYVPSARHHPIHPTDPNRGKELSRMGSHG